MPHSATYPVYRSQCGWNAILPPRQARTAAKIESSYDFAVVGAGYTGLAAARRLAELDPAARILLLEATDVGEGAAARNSGFILTVPFFTSHSGHAAETDSALRQIRIYRAALAWLKGIVDTGSIRCDWDDVGKYHAAVTDRGIAAIKSLAINYRQCSVACQEIDPAEFARRTGTSYYRYALHTGNNVFVQPAALVRGLADTLPKNVTLVEHTPVLSLSGSAPFILELPRKRVHARRVVIANNGFARQLGFFRNRLFNLYTYAGMTPELDDDQLAAHGSDADWGITPAARAGTTLRRPLGRRFLVRSLHTYEAEESMGAIATQLKDCYRRRYPHLRSHEFQYVWSGAVGLSRNAASCFGKIADGLYASAGCNGAGIMKGTAYGKLLAEQMMGRESPDAADVQKMNSPAWLPPEPLRRWGVALTIHRMVKQAGAER